MDNTLASLVVIVYLKHIFKFGAEGNAKNTFKYSLQFFPLFFPALHICDGQSFWFERNRKISYW